MINGKFRKRLLLVCEDEKTRDVLSYVIDAEVQGGILIRTYGHLEEAISHLHKDAPDVLLVTLRFVGEYETELLKRIKELRQQTEVILLVEDQQTDYLHDVLAAGVSSIVLKSNGLQGVTQSLEDVINGGSYLSPSVARALVESFWINPVSPLSDRETEVLKLITEGKSYSEIAHQLYISPETSRSHIRNIYRKLKVTSKSEVVRKALTEKLVPIG